ncbi:DeoR family transcriptional regulator, partial [Burkholderia pseudomallei]
MRARHETSLAETGAHARRRAGAPGAGPRTALTLRIRRPRVPSHRADPTPANMTRDPRLSLNARQQELLEWV